MNLPTQVKKAIILVFEDTDKEKTGIGENIPLSIEFDATGLPANKTVDTIKRSLKALNCVIVTTEKSLPEEINMVNQIRKLAKINKYYLREIKIAR